MGITDPSELHFDKGLWGFDGTVWRKLSLLWGYTDRLVTQEDDTVAAGTTQVQNHTAVASGYVHRVLGFSLWSDKAVSSVVIFANFGGSNYAIGGPYALGAGVYTVTAPFDCVLKAGDYVVASWAGLVAPQRVISNVRGYTMAVT